MTHIDTKLWSRRIITFNFCFSSSAWTQSKSCRQLPWRWVWSEPDPSWFPSWRTRFMTKTKFCWPWPSSLDLSHPWSEELSTSTAFSHLWSLWPPSKRPSSETRLSSHWEPLLEVWIHGPFSIRGWFIVGFSDGNFDKISASNENKLRMACEKQ